MSQDLCEEEIPMASETQIPQTQYAHIVHTPGTVGGEARIEGHRIRVRDVVLARDLDGLSPEEIAASVYSSLTLAEVYSALAYYEDHRDEINRAAEREKRFVEEFRQQHPGLVHDARPKKG
jgi:uncharacterized protein (DUF433 family)